MAASIEEARLARRASWLRTAMLGVAAVVALALPADTHAAAELTVSPLIVELDGEPGDTLTEQVTVSATGDEPITVEFRHADFGFDEESYQVNIIDDRAPETTPFSTRGWFSVEKERYTVKAGRSEVIPVSIEIPENATGGVHLGAAFFRTVVDAEGRGSQVLTSAQAGPLMFITVEGGSDPKPVLKRFDVPGVVKEGPIRADLQIENRGDNFFTYEGTVELRRDDKRWKADIPLKYVVPGQPRDVRDEEGDRLEFGTRKLGFGRYRVVTELRIEPTGKKFIEERTVWVVPGWVRGLLVALGGVLMGAVGWIVWWWRDRVLLRRAIAEGMTIPEDESSSDDPEDEDEDSGSEDVDEESTPEEAPDDDLDEEHDSEFDEPSQN